MEIILYKFLRKCPQICNAIIINKYSFLGRLGFIQNIFWLNTNFRYCSTSSCHLLDARFLHLQLAQRIAQSSPDRTRVIAVRPNYELWRSAVSSWWSLKSLGKVFFENWDFFDQCWSILIVLNKKTFKCTCLYLGSYFHIILLKPLSISTLVGQIFTKLHSARC